MARKQKPGSPDRTTRARDGVVIHTPEGKPYSHDYRGSRPIGLTPEQHDAELHDFNRKEREVREAAAGERQQTAWGNPSARATQPDRTRDGQTDEISGEPFGAGARRRMRGTDDAREDGRDLTDDERRDRKVPGE